MPCCSSAFLPSNREGRKWLIININRRKSVIQSIMHSHHWRSEQLSNQLKSDYSHIIPLQSKVSMVVNLTYFSIRIMKIVLSYLRTVQKRRKSVFQARISGRLVSRTKLQKKRTNIKLISIRISKLFIFFTACSLLFHLGEHQVHLRKETTAMCGEKTPKDFVCSIKWTLSFLLLHY